MALIFKGQHYVKNDTRWEVNPPPTPSSSQQESSLLKKETLINNDYRFDEKKTYLVVGGKVKEISSKSKYLLDMLIIEEEN